MNVLKMTIISRECIKMTLISRECIKMTLFLTPDP